MKSINIADKLSQINNHWSPRIAASMNDYHFKLVKFKGEFTWHSHTNTDEVFIIIEGEMLIHFRDKKVLVKKGEMIVVPKGVEHKPFAEEECHAMVVEKNDTINTGDERNEYTVDRLDWI